MEITASGVLTSCATPAASSPMRAELVGLHQPALQLGAVGHVVEDDQPADLLACPCETSGAMAMFRVASLRRAALALPSSVPIAV